jgi:hypothetical protein
VALRKTNEGRMRTSERFDPYPVAFGMDPGFAATFTVLRRDPGFETDSSSELVKLLERLGTVPLPRSCLL